MYSVFVEASTERGEGATTRSDCKPTHSLACRSSCHSPCALFPAFLALCSQSRGLPRACCWVTWLASTRLGFPLASPGLANALHSQRGPLPRSPQPPGAALVQHHHSWPATQQEPSRNPATQPSRICGLCVPAAVIAVQSSPSSHLSCRPTPLLTQSLAPSTTRALSCRPAVHLRSHLLPIL
jgi:hypothetical protein